MAQLLLAEYADNTLCLTLNRPKQRNALSYALLEELHQALSSEIQSRCRAVIICANDHCFSAGAELNELTGTIKDMEMDISISRVIDDIHRLSMPVVALIEGACVGGAVDIALACNVRVATGNAFFQIPATRLGLLYNPDSVARLSKLFPHETLTRLLVSGERFDAADAIKAGLVTHLVEQHNTGAKAAKFPQQTGTGTGQASASTRALLDVLYHDQYDPVYWRAVRRDILASPERRDAIARAKKKKHDT